MLRGPAVHIDTDLGDQPDRAVDRMKRLTPLDTW